MTLTRPLRATIIVVAIVLGAAGCARQISPDVVEGSTVGTTIQTFPGTIQQVRVVMVEEGDRLQDQGLGILLGGAAGGLAGSRIGGGFGRVVATGAGAAAGAAVGAVAGRELSRQQALEYTVRLDDGRLMTVVQGMDGRMQPGQRVLVQMPSRGRARVVPAA